MKNLISQIVMYAILFNENLLLDDYSRPVRYDEQDAAERRADALRKDNPRYKVEVIKRKISLNQVL